MGSAANDRGPCVYFAVGADRKALRKTLIACTTGTIGATVIMTLGPSLASLPHLWGLALAIAIVGAGLELLSTLSEGGSLAAAPAFACAASVLFWWFATGLDNYVAGGKGPHTVAALGLGLTKHPLAAGTGALGGLLAYAAANLNAKLAAQRLFVHVNTAHYRLARIEQKTGCDLRDLADVQELLIAIRLATGR